MSDNWVLNELENLIIGKGDYGINAPACEYIPNLFTYLRITDISEDGRFIENGKKSVKHPDAEKYLLSEGDITFARTGNSTGKTYLYNPKDGKLVFAGFLIRFKPDPLKLNSIFLKYVTQTSEYWNWVQTYSARTGQPGINGNEYGKLKIYHPISLNEQAKIARILSTADSVIEKTQAAIAKYEAIKQGMLHDLFTRGIDPATGKLRPTYEDAPELYEKSRLGWIPKEWEVEEFNELIKSIDSGWSPNCLVEPASVGEWGSLKTTSITWDGYNPDENKKLPMDIMPMQETEVDIDDILITRVGPRERVGVVVHVNNKRKKLMVSDNMLRLKILKDKNLILPFLALLLGSHYVQPEWQKRIAGLAEAQVVINQQIIKKTFILLPKIQEQKAIAEKLNNIMSRIKNEQTYLHKLQQIKAGLMADLLSGKKKVNVDKEPVN